MRDFDWLDNLYCVVKNDGTFAGKPCVSYDEARELSAQHPESHIYALLFNDDNNTWWDNFFAYAPKR